VTITAGTPFEFEASASSFVHIDALSSTKSIVLYLTGGDITARVIESDETVGAAFTVDSTGTGIAPQDIIAMSATKAMALWRDDAGVGNSNIKAQILNISGTTITAPGAVLTISGSDPAVDFAAGDAVSSTAVIAAINDTGSGITARAVYLTVSGSTITLESSVNFLVGGEPFENSVIQLTSTKAVVAFSDNSDSLKAKAVVLSVSGVTISAGSATTIDSNSTDTPNLAFISSTQCLASWQDDNAGQAETMVLDISGTTISTNTAVVLDVDSSDIVGLSPFSTTVFLSSFDDSGSTDGQMRQINVSGTTVTVGDSVQFESGAITDFALNTNLTATTGMIVYADNGDSDKGKAVIVTLSSIGVAGELDIAPMRKPADIDASGTFLYIAALDSNGFPVLVKLATSLAADGTLVFNPAAGTDIGVQCGRFDADTIWVAGAFDGTNVVEKSEDAGDTFSVKDTGAFGDVEAFVVGPDSDKRVLISDVTNDDIQETLDDGSNWTQINGSVGFDINAIARLGENVQEAVFGNDAAANDVIDYSVNSGDDMEDYTTGDFPTANNVTSVIVN
jgi:hypothetical protein